MNIAEVLIDLGIEESIAKKAEKSINKEIPLEFVAKDQYNKKVSELDETKNALKEAQGNAADADAYKTKCEALQGEFDTFKQSVENEKTIATKRKLAKKTLLESGVKEDILEDFILSALDYETVEIKDDAIKNADKFISAQKERYGKYFGEVRIEGADIANPLTNTSGSFAGKTIKELMVEANNNPGKVDEILAQIETMNTTKQTGGNNNNG